MKSKHYHKKILKKTSIKIDLKNKTGNDLKLNNDLLLICDIFPLFQLHVINIKMMGARISLLRSY